MSYAGLKKEQVGFACQIIEKLLHTHVSPTEGLDVKRTLWHAVGGDLGYISQDDYKDLLRALVRAKILVLRKGDRKTGMEQWLRARFTTADVRQHFAESKTVRWGLRYWVPEIAGEHHIRTTRDFDTDEPAKYADVAEEEYEIETIWLPGGHAKLRRRPIRK